MVIASLSQQMCCSKDQREVSFEILFQDKTPTADSFIFIEKYPGEVTGFLETFTGLLYSWS